MNYRIHQWIDLKKEVPAWGIQAKLSKLDTWHNCCEGSRPLIYYNRKDAVKKINDLRAALREGEK